MTLGSRQVAQYDSLLANMHVYAVLMEDEYVTFSKHSEAEWEFDAFQERYADKPLMERHYYNIGDRYFSSQAITKGVTQKVAYSASGLSGDYELKFVNRMGLVFSSTADYVVPVGGNPGDAQEVFAVKITSTDTSVVGCLFLPSYPVIERKVKIIPVNGAVVDATRIASFQEKLNATYNKVGFNYTVELDESMRNAAWCGGFDCSSFTYEGSNLAGNNYKGDEGKILDFYVEQDGFEIDANTAYMFAIGQPVQLGEHQNNNDEGEEEIQGKMFRGKQFGFLYGVNAQTPTDRIAKTLAHELGHGNFNLYHIFLDIYMGEAQRHGTNLMSYSPSPDHLSLAKFQWDIMHDPGVVWGILQRDRDAEYRHGELVQKIFQEIRCAYLNGEGYVDLRLYLPEVEDFKMRVNIAGEPTYVAVEYKGDGYLSLPTAIGKTIGSFDKTDYKPAHEFLGVERNENFIFEYKYSINNLIVYTHDFYFDEYLNPSEVRVRRDFNQVWNTIDINDGISDDEFSDLMSIGACATKFMPAGGRYQICKNVLGLTGSAFESKRDLVLDLLQTSLNSDDFHEFATLLNQDAGLYQSMHDHWHSERNDRLKALLLDIWSNSRFLLASTFTYSNSSPRVFQYNPDGYPRSYGRDYVFSTNGQNLNISVEGEDGDGDAMHEYYANYSYRPFQPIRLAVTDSDDDLFKYSSQDIPAFLLMMLDETADAEALSEAFALQFDIVMTMTGVGALTSLRMLEAGVWVYRAQFAARSISVAVDVSNILIDYTDVCRGSEAFCQEIQAVVMWVQIASGGADAVAEAMAERYARRALRSIDESSITDATQKAKVVKFLEDVADVSGDVARSVEDLPTETLRTRVSSLGDQTLIDNFLNDYFDEANVVFREAVDAQEELVESWKVVEGTILTTDVNALRKVLNHIESGTDINMLKADMSDILSTGNQILKDQWLNTLGNNNYILLRRGTDRYGELSAFDQSGYMLCDAAKSKYFETGNLEVALSYADDIHQQWLDLFDGDLQKYIHEHSLRGSEMESMYGLERTLISFTSDRSQISNFISNGGDVFIGIFERNKIIQQTLETSGESEFLIIGGTLIYNIQ